MILRVFQGVYNHLTRLQQGRKPEEGGHISLEPINYSTKSALMGLNGVHYIFRQYYAQALR